MRNKLTEKIINDWILANATQQGETKQGMDVARQKQLRQLMMSRAKPAEVAGAERSS